MSLAWLFSLVCFALGHWRSLSPGDGKAVKENELGGVIIHVIIVSYNHGIVLEIGKGGR
jgi:hypothetical protein